MTRRRLRKVIEKGVCVEMAVKTEKRPKWPVYSNNIENSALKEKSEGARRERKGKGEGDVCHRGRQGEEGRENGNWWEMYTAEGMDVGTLWLKLNHEHLTVMQ